MEDRVNNIIDKINNLSNIYLNPDLSYAFINLEDINDISCFNVAEIDLNIIIVNYNNWINISDQDDDDNFQLPQVKICYLKNNVYKIIFEFYDKDDIISVVLYELCTASIRVILTNLLNVQIFITDVKLDIIQ